MIVFLKVFAGGRNVNCNAGRNFQEWLLKTRLVFTKKAREKHAWIFHGNLLKRRIQFLSLPSVVNLAVSDETKYNRND